jgi:hypothetical protein
VQHELESISEEGARHDLHLGWRPVWTSLGANVEVINI